MRSVGFDVKAVNSRIDEYSDEIEIVDQIKDIAHQKAIKVAKKYPTDYVIGADTVVVLGDEIIGKPWCKQDAYDIIETLSGKTHKVITAYSIVNLSKNVDICRSSETLVEFRELDMYDIDDYIVLNDWEDKAGGYGIQSYGKILVKKIVGDYYTVVGLPIGDIYTYFKNEVKD